MKLDQAGRSRPRPWDGLVPDADIRAMEARDNPHDRETNWGNTPALIVVDMTRAFVNPGYPVSCWETGGEAATIATEQVLDAARRAAIPVFFTRILRSSPDGEFLPVELGRKLKEKPRLLATPPGLPDGNVVADRLGPLSGEVVISKPKPSAFYGTALDAYLNFFRIDTLIVTGMVTSGCVRATVIDGYMRNYQVIVPEEAVADYSDFQHRASLFDMHMKYADVPPVAEVVDHLRQGAPRAEPVGAGAKMLKATAAG